MVRDYAAWLKRHRRRGLRRQARFFVDPTGDDLDFRLVKVLPGEQTCRGCGDVFVGRYCERCGLVGPCEDEERLTRPRRERPPAVPTTSYLRPEEYWIVR
jgi:hypothetical protein